MSAPYQEADGAATAPPLPAPPPLHPGMQQRRFEFGGPQPTAVTLLCREPPEAQAGKTLTWQLAGPAAPPAGKPNEQSVGSGGARGSGSCAAAAPAPATHPDLIGLDIWPASIALGRYLSAHRQLVAGQAVLEVGAGARVRWRRGVRHEHWCGVHVALPASML